VLFPDASSSPADALVARMWPVGSVFVSTVDTNPAELLGFGVWSAFGAGRVLVGLDAGQAEFDALGETGGVKDVTLSAAQSGLPAHTHGVTDPGHTHVENSNNTSTGGLRGWGAPDTSTNSSTATGFSTASSVTGLTVNNATPAGAAQAHTNLMPYLVVRFWLRTG
jgi:microcystin-dependent protein